MSIASYFKERLLNAESPFYKIKIMRELEKTWREKLTRFKHLQPEIEYTFTDKSIFIIHSDNTLTVIED